jgi:hypothetical protein
MVHYVVDRIVLFTSLTLNVLLYLDEHISTVQLYCYTLICFIQAYINIIATSTTAEQCSVQEAQIGAFLQDVQVHSTSLPQHLLAMMDRAHPEQKKKSAVIPQVH